MQQQLLLVTQWNKSKLITLQASVGVQLMARFMTSLLGLTPTQVDLEQSLHSVELMGLLLLTVCMVDLVNPQAV
jgi:hypothetical protein